MRPLGGGDGKKKSEDLGWDADSQQERRATAVLWRWDNSSIGQIAHLIKGNNSYLKSTILLWRNNIVCIEENFLQETVKICVNVYTDSPAPAL